MADQLKAGAAIPPGQQNVVISQGSCTVQAPPSGGRIWFAYGLGSGSFTLTVNFNGQNFPNVQPGEYQLINVTTNLGLTLQGSGSAKLAWIPA